MESMIQDYGYYGGAVSVGPYDLTVTNNITLDSTLSVTAGNLASTDPQLVD